MIRRYAVAAAAAASVSAMTPAHAESKCKIMEMLRLPVTIVDASPTVPVTINGQKLQLIADSGAFFSTLSPGMAAELGLRLHPAPFGLYLSGIGGDADVNLANVADFGLGGHVFHKVDFLVGGSEVGEGGVMGQNVLGLADVEYDLPDGVISLMKPEHCYHASLAYWAKGKPFSVADIEPASKEDRHTAGSVWLDGVRLRAIFDTGASRSTLTLHAAKRLGFDPDSPEAEDAGYISGIGRRGVRSWIAPFASLKLGDNEEIRKIRLRVSDIDDADFDMLIGADFFLSHRVYVSNAQHKLYFSYVGGPVFDLSVHHDGAAVAAADTPTTAEGFSGRGTALAARHEYAAAKADLDHAVALAPKEARYRLQRSRIDFGLKDKTAARADLDAAIRLAPGNVEALLSRAELRLDGGDKPGALADADAADAAAAPQSDDRFELSQIYDAVDRPKKAIAVLGQWIDAHHVDSRLPLALNNRCWMRALNGIDIDGAVDDCESAVHRSHHAASFLDSLGLAHLRAGKPKDAIDDYDDALRIDPQIATSLYGRGLAKRRLGDAAGAAKDIAAAKAVDADVGKLFSDHDIR